MPPPPLFQPHQLLRDSTNYQEWSSYVRDILLWEGLENNIQETLPESTDDVAGWLYRDVQVRTIIKSSLSQKPGTLVSYRAFTAKDMWDILNKEYECMTFVILSTLMLGGLRSRVEPKKHKSTKEYIKDMIQEFKEERMMILRHQEMLEMFFTAKLLDNLQCYLPKWATEARRKCNTPFKDNAPLPTIETPEKDTYLSTEWKDMKNRKVEKWQPDDVEGPSSESICEEWKTSRYEILGRSSN